MSSELPQSGSTTTTQLAVCLYPPPRHRRYGMRGPTVVQLYKACAWKYCLYCQQKTEQEALPLSKVGGIPAFDLVHENDGPSSNVQQILNANILRWKIRNIIKIAATDRRPSSKPWYLASHEEEALKCGGEETRREAGAMCGEIAWAKSN